MLCIRECSDGNTVYYFKGKVNRAFIVGPDRNIAFDFTLLPPMTTDFKRVKWPSNRYAVMSSRQ